MADANGHETAQEMKMRLREKPLSELMEELEQMSSISEYDCDIDLICAYLDVLEEKAPVLPKGYDPAAEYEKFKENHSELFDVPAAPLPEKAPAGKSRFIRLKQTLVTFAALFCVVVFVADASGAGVLDRLIEWGSETFSLRPASGVMELEVAEENGFKSLAEALEYYGVEEQIIPTWIPKQFSIDKITVVETATSTVISGKYACDLDSILIRVAITTKENFLFENKSNLEETKYSVNGMEFLLSENIDSYRATWTVGEYILCSVSGNVRESELYEMLDSINPKEV